MANLTVIVAERDIPDFYRMLLDYQHNRGNTFVYMQQEIEKMFPKIKEQT